MASPGLTVAAAQTTPTRGDVEANVEQHLRLAHLAAGERARILVFPELSLTGYEPDLAADLAFSERDPRLRPLVVAASTHPMTLVVGAPCRIDSRLHIGAFVLSPDRDVEVYTKRHLGAFSSSVAPDGVVPPAETTVFRPGDLDPLVRVDDARAAIAVCADTGRASHPARAAKRGASLYLAGMFLVPADYERETANLAAHAARHRMAVVAANYGGPSGGLPAAGGSAIWSDTGELLVRLGPAGAGLAIATRDRTGWRRTAARLAV